MWNGICESGKNEAMRGIWIAALGLLPLLLLIPVRFAAEGGTTTGRGRLCLTVSWLLFRMRLHVDLYLLDAPQLTAVLQIGRGTQKAFPLSGGGGKPSRALRALYRSLRVERLAFCWRVGIRDAPALTALCCGALEQVGDLVRSMLFGKTVFCRAQIRAIPVFDTDQLRLDARGIASCVPAQIIAALLSEGKE